MPYWAEFTTGMGNATALNAGVILAAVEVHIFLPVPISIVAVTDAAALEL